MISNQLWRLALYINMNVILRLDYWDSTGKWCHINTTPYPPHLWTWTLVRTQTPWVQLFGCQPTKSLEFANPSILDLSVCPPEASTLYDHESQHYKHTSHGRLSYTKRKHLHTTITTINSYCSFTETRWLPRTPTLVVTLACPHKMIAYTSSTSSDTSMST